MPMSAHPFNQTGIKITCVCVVCWIVCLCLSVCGAYVGCGWSMCVYVK